MRFTVRFLLVLVFISLLGGGLLQGQAKAPSGSVAQPYAQATQVAPTFGPVIGGGGATPTSDPIAPTTAAPAAGATTAPTVAAPTATPLPTLKASLMGIQIYGNLKVGDWWGMVDRSQFMGMKWIKLQVSWKEIEPDAKGQFSPELDVLRDNAIYAGRRGFKILLSVAKAPDWARPANAQKQADGPPANPQDLADFITAVMNEFGSTEYINAIEVWNEPNTVTEWTGAPLTGASYVTYFNAAYKAIRAKDPAMTVITAGPAPTGDSNGSIDDRTWMQQLYSAGLPLSDPNLAIGIHPYGWANAPDARCCASPSKGWDDHASFFFLDTINDYHNLMVKNNDTTHKLWATEFGWPTFQGLHFKDHLKGPAAVPPPDASLGWMNLITEDQQAAYVVRAYQLAETGDLAGYMGPMFLWNMNFSTLPGYVIADKPSLPEAGYSVLDSDAFTRPVYNALQSAPKQ